MHARVSMYWAYLNVFFVVIYFIFHKHTHCFWYMHLSYENRLFSVATFLFLRARSFDKYYIVLVDERRTLTLTSYLGVQMQQHIVFFSSSFFLYSFDIKLIYLMCFAFSLLPLLFLTFSFWWCEWRQKFRLRLVGWKQR